jgi:hypothetical protein
VDPIPPIRLTKAAQLATLTAPAPIGIGRALHLQSAASRKPSRTKRLQHASVGTTVTATATLHSVVLEMAALVSDVTPVTATNASGTPFPPVVTPAVPRMHRGAMARED